MPQRFRNEVLKRLAQTGNLLVAKLQKEFLGPRSGRIGYKPGGGKYRVSAPWEYPASDPNRGHTGNIRKSLKTVWNSAEGKVSVGSDVPYATALEKKRPWLKRAANEAAKDIKALWSAPWKV